MKYYSLESENYKIKFDVDYIWLIDKENENEEEWFCLGNDIKTMRELHKIIGDFIDINEEEI